MNKKVKIKEIQFGICVLSQIPIRLTPDDRSEMTSQLLYGEVFEILKSRGKSWYFIRCDHDHYEGWIDKKQASVISLKQFEKYRNCQHFALELCQPILTETAPTQVLIGSSLPSFDGMSFELLQKKFVYTGQVFDTNIFDRKKDLLDKISRKYLGTPYHWGGRSPFGIDCSGFVQVVFKILGIKLQRDASQQIEHGEMVAFITQATVGDLAFFENKNGNIIHVGIILDNNKIIHASGEVRIDDIDHHGIYNGDRRSYSHKLRLIKRIL